MIKNLNTILISVIGSLIVAKIQPGIIIYVIVAAFIILILLNTFFGSRDRVRIRSVKQNLFNLPYSLKFEAENISDRPNSLKKTINLSCLVILTKNKAILFGENFKYTFAIKGNDRTLEPHKSKIFEAITNEQDPQLFVSKFRKFTIYPTRGRKEFIYSVGPSDRDTNYFRFYIKRFLYQFFKRVPT